MPLKILGLAAVLGWGIVSARKCENISVSVDIEARTADFDLETPVSSVDVTDFSLNLFRQGHNFTEEIVTSYRTTSGEYEIAATYCTPDAGPGHVVQLLTHGIGFDRSYWDLSLNDFNHSYVHEAVEHYGYSTLTWDRLGTAQSQHGEPVGEIQASLEVAALRALTTKLREGTLPCREADRFSTVVHGGHSFGSYHTYLLTAQDPTISDGIFLTSFSQNGSFTDVAGLGGNFVPANANPSFAFYRDGYLSYGNPSALQAALLAPGQFDTDMLKFAGTMTQPFTPGEMLTIGGETNTPNTYGGPVLIITGSKDMPFCGGDCLRTGLPVLSSIPESSSAFMANARPSRCFIVPEAGHALNLVRWLS